MNLRVLAAVVFLLYFAAPQARAAAPTALLGKTINFTYTVSAPLRFPDGRVKVGTRTETRTIYVSTAGRLFVRNVRRNNAGTADKNEQGPGDSGGSVRFAGNSIVGTIVRITDAYQFTIKFDSAYQSCNADLIFGHAAGEHRTLLRSVGGTVLEGAGKRSVSVSCSITSGNGL
jgi:hypothetical protein